MKKILLFPLAFAAVFNSFSQGNLIGRWDFTAGSLADQTTFLYDGTLVGSPVPDYDRFNNNSGSYRFFGSGDYIQTPCPGVSGTANRTISFWAKVSSNSANDIAINYGGAGLGGDMNIYLVTTPGNEGIAIDVSDEVIEAGTTVVDGKWHQYVLSYNNLDGYSVMGIKYYRDGVLITNLINPYNEYGHVINTATNTQVRIGGGDFNMDDVKLFNTALTGAQVDSLFLAEAPPNPCLLAKYDFSGNANDGMGSNNCTVSGATLTTDRFGSANSAYDFNGTTDFLATTGNVNLVGQSFTIGYWAKRTVLDGNWHAIVSQGTSAVTDQGLHIGLTGTIGPKQNAGFDFYNDGIYDTLFADSTDWNQWYFTYDYSTGTGSIYVNGVLTHSQIFTGAYAGTGGLVFGQTAWGGNFFQGKLDDIKVFNCGLSPTEIDSVYQLEKVTCTLAAALTPTSISCFGLTDGSITSNVTGAMGTVSYGWQPGAQTTPNISGLSAGGYTLSISDDAGCTTQQTANVNEPSQIVANFWYITQPFCPGQCTGTVNYYVTGGSGGESFLWMPSAQTGYGSANSLCAGSYTVTVTDVNGCADTDTFSVVDPPPLVSNISTVMPISCNGMCDGIVAVDPTGGTPGGGARLSGRNSDPVGFAKAGGGYTINWQPGNSGFDTISGLCAGTYTVNITDGNGCSLTDSVTLINPAVFSVTASSTNPTCYVLHDGTATAVGSGGTAPYNFNWSNTMTGSPLTGLDSISNLIVNATDDHGCMAGDTINVGAPNPFFLTLTINNSACGASAGSISTVLTGGSGPFNYLWNTGDVTTNISSIPSGQYFIEVYDVNGCYTSEVGIVNDAGGPAISLNSVTDVTCAGANNGAVDVSITGGALPYDISWSTGANTEDISGVAGSSYDLVVTDSIGCITSFIATVNEPSSIYIAEGSLSSGCGFTNGRADAIVSGGTSPYTFMWDATAANQTTASAFNVGSGTYKVIVTDNHSCLDSAYIAVSDSTGPIVYLDSIQDAGCVLNGGSGAVYITPIGDAPFTFQWNNGATTEDVSGLGIGIFGVIVTDTNGCKGGTATYIHGLRPGTAQICLASVDTSNMHNIIIWNDTVVGVALYEIFRETSVPNQYNQIATIQAGTTNMFEDSVADADNKPWRYKITATDSCGIQSHYSVSHKPIHLVVTTGIGNSADLSWDQYQGVNYNYYYILRYHYTTGWVLVDSVPYGSATVYNDPTGLTPIDSNYYFIEVKPNVSCGASRSIVNTSRSNIKHQLAGPALGIAGVVENSLSVFPNPSKNEFNLRFGVGGKYVLKTYDARGRLLGDENISVAPNSTTQIKSADWAQGIYFMQVLYPDGKSKTFKLIKQ